MRMTLEHLAMLRQDYPTLHSKALPFTKNVGGSFVDIDADKLESGQQQLLKKWMKDEGIHDFMNCACSDCLRILNQRVAEAEVRETARLEAEQNYEAGLARLGEYLTGAVPGFRVLLNTLNNQTVFNAFIVEQTDKPVGPALVDYAMDALQLKLDWEKQRTLPNGEPELPLNADKAALQRASITQLKDYFKRSGGQELLRKQTYAGSIRTSWFKATSQVV